MGDGERETVTVEADNIRDARAKARAGAETGSTIGLPVLQVAPTTTPAPLDPALEVGSEWGDAIPSITAPPRRTTFRDFTKEIDPDLFDPGSSTFVPPPVITVPTPPVTGFDPNIDPLINPDLFDPNAPITPPGTGAFGAVPTAPPTVIDPGGLVSRGGTLLRGGGFGPTAQAGGMGGPPAVVPPAVMPPAVSGFADDVPFAADVGPVGGGAVNGAGGGLNLLPPVLDIEREVMEANGGMPPPGGGGAGGNGEVVIDPATGLPVLTSRELMLDPFMERAGQRLALRNIFGDQATGVGPVSGYLQRQLKPLTSAFLGGAWADMARGFGQDQPLALAGQGGTAQGPPQYPYASPALAGGGTTVDDLGGTSLQDFQAAQAAAEVGGAAAPATGVAAMPGYSFEDFLRTTRGQDTGLGGAYGQALQNVGYLRGLGQGAVPPALAGILSPETSQGTWDARNLLGAAQKGRYSGLVSRSFRQPSEQDLFADYVLARQDATAAGQAPQNFLNFAASRYGL